MSQTIKFSRQYAEFGSKIRDFEKSDSVGAMIRYIMCKWKYSIQDIVHSQLSSVWLGEGEKPEGDINDLDLVLKIANSNFFELILRVDEDAFYGGYLFGDELAVSDEIVNGHRVLLTKFHGDEYRYEYSPSSGQYEQVYTAASGKMKALRQPLRKSAN